MSGDGEDRPFRPVLEALELLVEPGGVAELRAIGIDGRVSSGYFGDLERMAAAAEVLDASGEFSGVYLTLNPVDPALLARRANRVQSRLGRKDATTADGDILRRRWLPIDVDPVRPSGISATADEHRAACRTARAICDALTGLGWPRPIVADSGNGGHLLYRIDLPNDAAATALVKGVLGALDARFSTEEAKVDTANFNAARIWKCYGTVGRKGDSTRERPHTRSAIISRPYEIAIVPASLLRAVAGSLPAPEPPTPAPAASPRGGIDLRAWLAGHGIEVATEKPWQGGTLFNLADCPFSDAHTDGAFAVQFANGAVHAGCKHDSCGGGRQRWPELRSRFEGARPGGDRKEAARRTQETEAGRPEAAPAGKDEAQSAEARAVLETGDPLAYMVRAFNRDHIGDQVLARCLALSLASRLVRNSKGLHVMTTGESGKGKSDGYRVMLRQIPAAFKLRGSFSDKSLYYKEDLRPQSVFVVDDKDLSDSIQEVLKEATSDFREPIEHHTLTTDRKPIVCRIPARCLWWVAKAEGTGDDQVLNRMLMVWVDESEEQDRAVLAGVLARELRDDDEADGEPHEVAVCRSMWEQLHARGLVEVNLSRFAHRIRFSSSRNRRNPIMLIDLIRSVAALRVLQREQRELPDGTLRIYAAEEDFTTAAAIFTALHGVVGSQDVKLTKREALILDVISAADLAEFTMLKVQSLTKLPYQQVYRTFLGYTSRGAKYSGLLEKCPALGTLEKTISSPDDAGSTVRRRVTAFTFSRAIYSTWTRGGLVWLVPEGTDGGDRDGDDIQHLQQISSSSSAPAEDEARPESGANGGDNIESACVQDTSPSFSADPENTRSSSEDSASASVRVCDPRSAEDGIERLDHSAPMDETALEGGSIAFSTCCTSAESGTKSGASAESRAGFSLAQVNPTDYAPIPDGIRLERCPLCGGQAVHYIEKYKVRQARGPGAVTRRICRRCYAEARRREQSAVRVLPGTLPIGEIAPVEPGRLGRCTVCGLESAAYRHPGSSTAICSSCYEKLVQEQIDIR